MVKRLISINTKILDNIDNNINNTYNSEEYFTFKAFTTDTLKYIKSEISLYMNKNIKDIDIYYKNVLIDNISLDLSTFISKYNIKTLNIIATNKTNSNINNKLKTNKVIDNNNTKKINNFANNNIIRITNIKSDIATLALIKNTLNNNNINNKIIDNYIIKEGFSNNFYYIDIIFSHSKYLDLYVLKLKDLKCKILQNIEWTLHNKLNRKNNYNNNNSSTSNNVIIAKNKKIKFDISKVKDNELALEETSINNDSTNNDSLKNSNSISNNKILNRCNFDKSERENISSNYNNKKIMKILPLIKENKLKPYKRKELIFKNLENVLKNINTKYNRISTPYMSTYENNIIQDLKSKEKWINKDGFISTATKNINNSCIYNYIPNYINISSSKPPLLHKFREVDKSKWINKKIKC